jgi:hypothetical protein
MRIAVRMRKAKQSRWAWRKQLIKEIRDVSTLV